MIKIYQNFKKVFILMKMYRYKNLNISLIYKKELIYGKLFLKIKYLKNFKFLI